MGNESLNYRITEVCNVYLDILSHVHLEHTEGSGMCSYSRAYKELKCMTNCNNYKRGGGRGGAGSKVECHQVVARSNRYRKENFLEPAFSSVSYFLYHRLAEGYHKN